MKRLSYIIAVSFFMIGMIACDKINEPYFKPNNEAAEHIPITHEDIINWENKKVVLLEDYTGVRCNNCPAAGEIALDLYEQYDHQLVVLSVHAGFLASPIGGFPDFTTEEGTEWYTNFGFDSNPIGTINRKLNGSTYGYNASSWADAVAEAVVGQPDIRLLTAVEYDEQTRELTASAYTTFLKEFTGKYNLTVCLMEDNIVGKQLLPDGVDTAYMHRHVFRGTLNGAWGSELEETLVPEEDYIKTYSITLNENFNADNCYIVAYIYDRDTKEILQVTEKKIK